MDTAEAIKDGVYRTPQAAINAMLANPPMVDIPPADEPIDPKAPKMVRGEPRHMSIPEASGILMELARKRSMSIVQIRDREERGDLCHED